LYDNQDLRFDFSDCKDTKSAALDDDESLAYRYLDGDTLSLVHRNVYFNCCQEEGNLSVEFNLDGDSLIINEYEKEVGVCDCICPYDLESKLGPLQNKEYWLILKVDEQERFKLLIDFKKGMEGVKSL